MTFPWSIYTAPLDELTPELVRAFVTDQVETGAFRESLTLELKAKRSGTNVVDAVCAFANTDGGIVLLGVDEKNPDFDSSPGVDRDRGQLGVADQCRQLLSPTLIPEMKEVPLSGNTDGKVIVIIRVEPSNLMPVMVGGRIMVRAPGQSVPATRDQAVTLLQRGEAGGLTVIPGMQSLNALNPQLPDPDVGQPMPDAIVRVVGGVWLRPRTSDNFMLGKEQRDALVVALIESRAGRLHRHMDGPLGKFSAPWRLGSHSSTGFSVEASWTDSGGGVYSTRFEVRRDGPRLAFIVDQRLRERPVTDSVSVPLNTGTDPRLSGSELATTLLSGLEAVSMLLPNVVTSPLKDGPQRVEFAHGWVLTGQREIGALLDNYLDGAKRRPMREVHSMSFATDQHPPDLDQAAATVEGWLQHLYLELGCDDEQALAHADVAACRRRLNEL